MILVSPTEPLVLKDLGRSSSIPEQYGADLLIIERNHTIGIQRKVFPSDFMASLTGDRMSRLLPKLGRCSASWLVLEGEPAWTPEGFLVGYDYATLNRTQVRGVLFSAYHEFGVPHAWTSTIDDTIDWVQQLHKWAGKTTHSSLYSRPGAERNPRGYIDPRTSAVWLLQSIEGVGPKLATDIYDHFGRVPLSWDADDEEFLKVKGLGPKRLDALRKALA